MGASMGVNSTYLEAVRIPKGLEEMIQQLEFVMHSRSIAFHA